MSFDTQDPKVDTERALGAIRQRIESEGIRPVVGSPRIAQLPVVNIWLKGLAAAASVVLVLTLLTVSGVAETILTIFEPKQVVAVPITSTDIQTAMNSLQSYGTLEWSTKPEPAMVPDAATAARESGLTVVRPGALPGSVNPLSVHWGVMPKTTATFTFSAAITTASAAKLGRTPPPMPANIDGSKLFITGGPAVLQVYGDLPKAGASTSADPLAAVPQLIIAQGKAPTVQSNGVTVEQLQAYLLAQPGITPQLAAEIKAIKDPSSTLPIPVPVNMGTSKDVTVQGVHGVFIGDTTGLGSVVIWEKDGIVYGVAGTLSESDIMAVANSLH